MKLGFFLGVGLLGFFFFGLACHQAQAAATPVVISELQASGVKADDEFVRLRNETAAEIDLAGFKLSKKSLVGGSCKESALVSAARFQGTLSASGSFLIAHPDYRDFYQADLGYSSASYYLTDNTIVLLYDASGTLLDRKVVGVACDTPLPDPDPAPSPDPTPPPTPTAPSVRLHEVLGNPLGDENEGEFIEFYNAGDSADLSGFVIRDASKTGSYTFPPGTTIDPGAYFLLKRSASKISLNNSNETLSLFDRAQILVDSMHYDKTKEGVSLNYTTGGWRGGTPTPGAANQLNTLPDTKEKVPKKGYRGVPVAFDARGKDADGDHLKYTWNFGDDHKSYKGKTSHTYDKTGTYSVTLTTTDGSDDVVETFTLKIESFPEPDVRITALVPNPSGKDTESEWLLLENRGKKAVDLKGFGIATGWKKLANHPIRESFVIAPRSEARLTREFSLFTLPNEKGQIELRAPDGKVLQNIKYKLEKSAEEDTVYFKEKGKRWAWRAADTAAEPATEPIAQEDAETSEIIPEDTLSEPDSVEEPEKEVLGAAVVADTPNPNYLKLLNYGTGVTLPPDITLSFPDSTASSDGTTEREHYAITFVKTVFTEMNTALNELQNEAE